MDTLHLTLKKQWFEKIFCHSKRQEYREIKPYWLKRLYDCLGVSDTQIKAICKQINASPSVWAARGLLDAYGIKPRKFKSIQFRNGYKSNSPVMRTSDLINITIGRGREDWGAPDSTCIIIEFFWIDEWDNIPEEYFEFSNDPNLPF